MDARCSRGRPTAASRGNTHSQFYDPGVDAQTIANQIVVLPDGELVNLFVPVLEDHENSPKIEDLALGVIRSRDRARTCGGLTWSAPRQINIVTRTQAFTAAIRSRQKRARPSRFAP